VDQLAVRPDASCALSAQATRQPRASRPAIGAKWNQPGRPSEDGSSLQPQEAQVTGPVWGSDEPEMPLVSKAG
jgi:hypothetical protein